MIHSPSSPVSPRCAIKRGARTLGTRSVFVTKRGIGTKEAKEVVVVNANDRYSAYNMMAGVRSPMAQHGRIPRDLREPRTRNTAPW
jgi:hypothetical protein